MPLYRAGLYQQGMQIYCAPTVDSRDTGTATMRHISVEGRCYVLSASQFADRADYPEEFAPIRPGKPDSGTRCLRHRRRRYPIWMIQKARPV